MLTGLLLLTLSTVVVDAARLGSRTLAAFDRYVALTESRMKGETSGTSFLWIDRLAEAKRREMMERLRNREVVVDRLETLDGRRSIDAPDGMIHHWTGTVLINAPLADVLRVLQDYDHHDRLFAPGVAQSSLRSHAGDDFKVHLRFSRKKVVTVVIDTENDIHYARPRDGRAEFRATTTRVSEVEHAGTPEEAVRPPDDGRGYMWRLNTYGRFEERDGGTVAEFETITLSRDIPFGFGWLIGPFVTSVPRESLAFTLERLRDTAERNRGAGNGKVR
jgi:hypothetical protein